MGLRPAKSHEKLVLQDWWGGGRRPRRPAGAPPDADIVVPAAGRGGPPRTRGSAPPFPEGGFSPLSSVTTIRNVDRRRKPIVCPTHLQRFAKRRRRKISDREIYRLTAPRPLTAPRTYRLSQ